MGESSKASLFTYTSIENIMKLPIKLIGPKKFRVLEGFSVMMLKTDKLL